MRWLLIGLLAILSYSSAMANVFYCSNQHQYIQLGYGQAQVKAACGEPTKTSTQTVPNIVKVPTQTWLYTYEVYLYRLNPKPEFSIQFKNGKVTSVNVESASASGLSVCDVVHGINVGDSTGKVHATCGEPAHISHSEEPEVEGLKTITIWEYDFGPNQPSARFEFEGGKLSKIN